ISHPWPASTCENPRTSRKKTRSAVTSLLYTITWAPKIMNLLPFPRSNWRLAPAAGQGAAWNPLRQASLRHPIVPSEFFIVHCRPQEAEKQRSHAGRGGQHAAAALAQSRGTAVEVN